MSCFQLWYIWPNAKQLWWMHAYLDNEMKHLCVSFECKIYGCLTSWCYLHFSFLLKSPFKFKKKSFWKNFNLKKIYYVERWTFINDIVFPNKLDFFFFCRFFYFNSSYGSCENQNTSNMPSPLLFGNFCENYCMAVFLFYFNF